MRTKIWLRRKEAVTVVGGKIRQKSNQQSPSCRSAICQLCGEGALNDEPIVTLNWKCHQRTKNKTVVRLADAKHREGFVMGKRHGTG